jgi:hypothetical protein
VSDEFKKLANLDTRTKEVGVLVMNCPRLAEDAANLFDVYWELGKTNRVPKRFPFF